MSQLVTGPENAAPEPLRRPLDQGPPQRSSLAGLLVFVGAVVLAAFVTHTTSVLIVIVALVIMIMLHELGHLLTAKWGGMKVTEYFLGFGPRLWSIRRGETEYGIKAIPAGGYVKILGMTSAEQVDPADEARTYRQRPFHNRLLVAVAGSAMHGVMAFVLLWGLFVFIGAPQGNAVAISGFAPLAHGIDPARAAGLQAGDVVTRVNGKAVHSATDLQKVIEDSAGTPITVVVERAGQDRTIVVTPQAATAGAKGHIGVLIGPPSVRSGPVSAVPKAGHLFGQMVTGSFAGIGQVFSASGINSYVHDLTSAKAASQAAKTGDRPQSIYGAARIAVQGAQAGATQLIYVLTLIILFVGIINLFPMLPLDGGHVVIAVYERIRSRRDRPYHADVNKLTPIVWAFVLLLGFIVFTSLYLDITHPVKNPFQ
ncbi:MAG TPA: M50 family metallopeptidase [Acidimicrobiales bacterium]|nr:M50 family metallopeptidase [Acidimicrobiales bacterium]